MSDIENQIKRGMAGLIKRLTGLEVTVEKYVSRISYEGHCDTCSYETVVVDIYYTASSGVYDVYTYNGDLADLIREIS